MQDFLNEEIVSFSPYHVDYQELVPLKCHVSKGNQIESAVKSVLKVLYSGQSTEIELLSNSGKSDYETSHRL